MRGADGGRARCSPMWISSRGCGGPSAACDPRGRERGAGGDVTGLRGALFARWAGRASRPSGCCGRCCCRLLLGALGAAADGAAGVRPLVPLVRRARGGRSGVGRELSRRTATGCWRARCAALPGAVLALPEVRRLLVERALLGGRHAAPGLGHHEELPAEEPSSGEDQGMATTSRRGAGATARRLQGREALERDPCQHHRPGRAALSQGRRPAGGALLHRARADGEPQRADRRRGGDAGHRRRRAAGGDRAGRGPRRLGRRVTLGADKAYDTATSSGMPRRRRSRRTWRRTIT